MSDFAKIFNSEKFGQICVIWQESDSEDIGMEIRFFCQPEGFGVCSAALSYENSEDGYALSENAFNNKVDLELSEKAASQLFDTVDEMVKQNDQVWLLSADTAKPMAEERE